MITTLYRKERAVIQAHDYEFVYWRDFDFSIFEHIYIRKKGGKKGLTFADVIIMADTETSKKKNDWNNRNHICAWGISFRAFGLNIATLWGQNPREFPEMLEELRKRIKADEIYIYFHNLAYDHIFLRKFMYERFGFPVNQLNVKPLYPLYIKYSNGIVIKDSLLLAQRSLEKWADDLKVSDRKACGKWDYNKIRNQSDILSDDELLYIEHDVLAGVECLDATLKVLKTTIGHMPYTATGIVRGECRNEGHKNHAHEWFLSIQPDDYKFYTILELLFSGGYTHANRNIVDFVFPAICFDISSSYPTVLLSEKFPAEKFWKVNRKVDCKYIINNSENYAFVFRLRATGVELYDKYYPMPFISKDKAQYLVNPINDNGRVTSCSELEIYFNEIDLEVFLYQYKCKTIELTEVYAAYKDYLPKWLTDYVYKRFELKSQLKLGDPILYQIEKAKLNSIYGMTAQHCVRWEINENYETGDFEVNENYDPEKEYKTYLNKFSSFLPYTIAPWVTSSARKRLFQLGSCVSDKGIYLYSDTDSVYATKFNMKKINNYNKQIKEKLKARGYGGVKVGDKTYYLGIAEKDGEYSQFKTLHAKVYCKRPFVAKGDNFIMSDDLKITVAGVPKEGAKSLNNNINNFKTFFCFDGKTSGKKQHQHNYVDKIYTDEEGNITGDSIDLTYCDYIIGQANIPRVEDLIYEEVEVQIFDDGDY